MGSPSTLMSFLPPAVEFTQHAIFVLLFSSQQKLAVDLIRVRAIFSPGAVGMNSSAVLGQKGC